MKMTNKIPQEIEEKIEMWSKGCGVNIDFPKGLRYCNENDLCKVCKTNLDLYKAELKGFKAGQKQSKGKLTLNHKCPLCNKNIFLGDDVVIQKRMVYHLNCYDKEEKQDEN
jgi:hypothetical protein